MDRNQKTTLCAAVSIALSAMSTTALAWTEQECINVGYAHVDCNQYQRPPAGSAAAAAASASANAYINQNINMLMQANPTMTQTQAQSIVLGSGALSPQAAANFFAASGSFSPTASVTINQNVPRQIPAPNFFNSFNPPSHARLNPQAWCTLLDQRSVVHPHTVVVPGVGWVNSPFEFVPDDLKKQGGQRLAVLKTDSLEGLTFVGFVMAQSGNDDPMKLALHAAGLFNAQKQAAEAKGEKVDFDWVRGVVMISQQAPISTTRSDGKDAAVSFWVASAKVGEANSTTTLDVVGTSGVCAALVAEVKVPEKPVVPVVPVQPEPVALPGEAISVGQINFIPAGPLMEQLWFDGKPCPKLDTKTGVCHLPDGTIRQWTWKPTQAYLEALKQGRTLGYLERGTVVNTVKVTESGPAADAIKVANLVDAAPLVQQMNPDRERRRQNASDACKRRWNERTHTTRLSLCLIATDKLQ